MLKMAQIISEYNAYATSTVLYENVCWKQMQKRDQMKVASKKDRIA